MIKEDYPLVSISRPHKDYLVRIRLLWGRFEFRLFKFNYQLYPWRPYFVKYQGMLGHRIYMLRMGCMDTSWVGAKHG